MLSPQTIRLVQATVPIIREHGPKVTSTFYRNILTENPSLKSLFNQGNQASGHQAQALAHAVLAYASYIENPAVLGAAIKHITAKHASLFIKPEQYAVVGKYLLDAFGECLGDAFTPEIRNAWAEAYGQLADIMIAAEAELYKKTAGWDDWRDFVVKTKTPESSEITSFCLYPSDGKPLPKYLPGQYISVQVHVPSLDYNQIRQYSLSDSYTPEYYRISVKKEPGLSTEDTAHPGLVSCVLHDLVQEGDIVRLSSPQGNFHLDANAASTPAATCPLILVSAGVGVTPMLSMLNTVTVDTPSRPVTWIHGANTSQKRAFSNHINKIAEGKEHIRIVRFISQPAEEDKLGLDYDQVGRVDLEKCDAEKDLALHVNTAKYYICGPDKFMTGVTEQLKQMGVDSERIQSERFGTGGF